MKSLNSIHDILFTLVSRRQSINIQYFNTQQVVVIVSLQSGRRFSVLTTNFAAVQTGDFNKQTFEERDWFTCCGSTCSPEKEIITCLIVSKMQQKFPKICFRYIVFPKVWKMPDSWLLVFHWKGWLLHATNLSKALRHFSSK